MEPIRIGFVGAGWMGQMALNRAGRVEVYSDPGDGVQPQRAEPTLPWVHAMRQQAINFVKVCRGEMAPPETAAGALIDLKVAREYIRMHSQQENA